MVKYEDCFIDNKGKLRVGIKVKKITGIKAIDRIISKEPIPKIILTKKEAQDKNLKVSFVISEDGVRIPIDII